MIAKQANETCVAVELTTTKFMPGASTGWASVMGRCVARCSPALAFVVLMAIGAQIRIPVPGTDVPMTLQSMAALLAGFALSPAMAFSAVAIYVGCGVAGLPVFAPGSMGLAGPTGGYLVGFILAAWLIARLRGTHEAGVGRLALVGLLGTAVIFLSGSLWRLPWIGDAWAVVVATSIAPFAVKAVLQLVVVVSLVVAVRGAARYRKPLS